MAHHQKQQQDGARRGSAMQSLLKMFSLSSANFPTLATGEDDVVGEADEPPDEHISDLPPRLRHRESSIYPKSAQKPQNPRRESLLTRAIWEESHPESLPTSPIATTSRGLSTASSHSTASMGDLTSDGDLTSARSDTPSPPPPLSFMPAFLSRKNPPPSKVVIAPVTKEENPTVAAVGEAAVEKTLGRKRCIMFACGGKSSNSDLKPTPPKETPMAPVEPPKRKCMLTFACPSRQEKILAPSKPVEARSQRKPSPAPSSKRRLSTDLSNRDVATIKDSDQDDATPKTPLSPQTFHEFGSSPDETDAWVHKSVKADKKLTLSDCMKKENAIRQTCTQAEEEAEEEEREQEELENELEEGATQEDDFAPSDDESDGGNESDDEGGFADSDDESDAGSDYQFWAPALSTTTAATSTENLTLSHFSSRGRSRASSLDSDKHSTSPNASIVMQHLNRRKALKLPRMRPGTPELPDSTDFVCGTLDEDRPLEAAYISCREQKKREKHVPIPQDIDPSFPTTDPEDQEDEGEDEEVEESLTAGGPAWMKDQFAGFDKEGRGRPKTPIAMATPTPPPNRTERPFPLIRRSTNNRSPPPKRGLARSPAPKKLFGHSPARLRSPPPQMGLRSPPGSPNALPGVGFTINRLAQRPLGRGGRERTTSLPRTPNPFFRNFKVGSLSISNVASGAVSPALEDAPRSDVHVRGPVDIVMGLEKKRQKRKEKFWRQHCRKQAKEQAEKRTAPGRGAERMKELGLECAERNRGYGLGQTQLVISL